ncbi:MAG: hypothetical protein ACI81L_001482 [Verrucomicrobiales bacterium]|jgi:hypothetical protein
MKLPDAEVVERLATQTLDLLETEYPNGIRLTMSGPIDEPIRPSSIYPAFYGCYDWHSAVHSHWQVVRALRVCPDANFATDATEALHASLAPENIAIEMRWIAERASFEMPYGMAWLLTLSAELHEWATPDALEWHEALAPMEQHAVERFRIYCQQLRMPIRGGMHNQTAFSFGLVWDYAERISNHELLELIGQTATRLYGSDTNIDVAYEPSADDFLSPSLAEADLMRRVLVPDAFNGWLDTFAPSGFRGLEPVDVVDPSDGQLAHWAGLNLSRAWMFTRIANALPTGDPRAAHMRDSASAHTGVGLPMALLPDYMISHWVPTFAVYLLTMASDSD